jgi:hypothetical protein
MALVKADIHDFVDWLNVVQINDDEKWMFVGDFNFYRSLENRNIRKSL